MRIDNSTNWGRKTNHEDQRDDGLISRKEDQCFYTGSSDMHLLGSINSKSISPKIEHGFHRGARED